MGRRGYVQTRPAEYGACITDWAQNSLYRYLTRRGLEVNSTDDLCNTEDADHWEIPIPEKGVGRGKKRKRVYNYDKILKVAADLRKNPKAVKADDDEGEYGDLAASMLEEGIKAAKKHKLGTITIDWW